MEYIVKRKKKQYNKDYLFELDSKKEVSEEKAKKAKESKENILKKYIESDEFKKALTEISLSQLNRFYSLLEERNFSFTSSTVLEFVEEQIERNQGEIFYKFFKNKFLNEEFEKMNEQNRTIAEMIKRYIRYNIGQKRLSGEEEGN